MSSSRNFFEMMCFSRFIILQSVVTRYLFVQKVVDCCHINIEVKNKRIEIPAKHKPGIAEELK